MPSSVTTLPPSIEHSLREALVDTASRLVVQHNADVVRIELGQELQKQGVILTSLDSAVREYPELVSQYFMERCVPVQQNKYTAMHAAFWSGGFFLYVPKGVEIDEPILTQFWIDEPSSAAFYAYADCGRRDEQRALSSVSIAPKLKPTIGRCSTM